MSFGDGRLSRAGEPRYDRAAARGGAVRVTLVAVPGWHVPSRLRIGSSCRDRYTLHLPRFAGDTAFLGVDLEVEGVPGRQTTVIVFRRDHGRWRDEASGTSDWGRPVI